ncbi:MAG: hypothetical protein B7Y07_01980 [Halothiobacillus sp. 24-54-40]|jgi:uncharacterized membrane protein|nr:MAG: hypothetical protein B7Y58_01585 [Halothiobacillus sp. 35-54-62]OYZ87921.1 MAG: hypothetical protein B7Y07_01980 [Halothiobacillus sp. 24-54-40]OZA81460.1 MAG: hypothetical protein B7X64_01775 [Halothiobacillus sp. 39-53-45]
MIRPVHTPNIVWLRRIIFAVQPMIAAGYLMLAGWGESLARPQGAWLLILVLPALLVLPGMWAGRYTAFVWAALADLFYILIASTDAWSSPMDRELNSAILVLAMVGFCAAWAQGIIFRRIHRRSTPRH